MSIFVSEHILEAVHTRITIGGKTEVNKFSHVSTVLKLELIFFSVLLCKDKCT